ncbi:hypothetical protein [Halorussus sp. AFM4]|uniref:hypothetical protein n=1 Tax=Halorussus sp. AFM4 TaxID=3421651 RepID=UPI003EBBD9A6
MLVNLEQYQHDDADDAVRSGGDVDPDRDADDYFGTDDLDAEEWERVTEDGETLLRRSMTLEEVTAVSVPREQTHEDLPGVTVQIRKGGEEEYVDNARIVEVQDPDP